MAFAAPYGLNIDGWQSAATDQRLDSLQELENAAANDEGRPPCEVHLDPNSDLHPSLLGSWNKGEISINAECLNNPEPYEAVETIFHESRHAHQEYVISHPELAGESGTLQEWSENIHGGYLSPHKDGFSSYRFQPIEADANTAARERTDNLYSDHFEDEQYAAYRNDVESREALYRVRAEAELGPHYEEMARERMHEAYEDSQNLSQKASLDASNHSEGEDEDRNQGYGLIY